MIKKSQRPISRQSTSPTTFRGVLHAVDQLLKTMNPETPEYALLSNLREDAVGPENAKCWKEILRYLRKCGHGAYRKTDFQTGFLQFCRKNDFFIASCHKGFYLPGKSEDFEPYLTATARRIRGEQANMRAAIRLGRLQEEWKTSRKTARTRTRTTARRAGADRPTATGSPRKARSMGR